MARFGRLDVLQAMRDSGLVPVFHHPDPETAKNIARAVADGGVTVLEFTNRGDFAWEVFIDLVRWCAKEIPDVILGAGSVIDPGTAALYMNNGANFIVGPVFNADVARVCNRRKIPYLPGCGSAAEISLAEEYGVEICKFFPGKEAGGPGFVKNLLGPMPWTLVMPTGGVETTRKSIAAWFEAGVACVGIGSNLIAKDLVAAGDFAGIAEKTAEVLGWIDEARGRPVFAGVEHVGLHAAEGANAGEIARWYADTFGFASAEGQEPHIAVRVTNFERAVDILRAKGVELEAPKIAGGVKTACLKNPDPAGNRVHLFWRR